MTDKAKLVFEAPPVPNKGPARSVWKERLSLLAAEHSGEWVNVNKSYGLKSSSSTGARAHVHKVAKEMRLKVEATTRGAATSNAQLYIRVVKNDG